MGAPLPPAAIMPSAWANKAELRALPQVEGLESHVAFWIEELSSWIAEDEDDADLIRESQPSAKIIFAESLRSLPQAT